MDSINKKLKVVEAVAGAIDLNNITVQHTRAEDIHNKKFDLVVSRAVAPLKDLWYWSKPLLKKRPVDQPKKITGLICLKGGDLNNEITESGCRPRIWEIEKIFEEEFLRRNIFYRLALLNKTIQPYISLRCISYGERMHNS